MGLIYRMTRPIRRAIWNAEDEFHKKYDKKIYMITHGVKELDWSPSDESSEEDDKSKPKK